MADASNRQASLRAASGRPDVRGWAVIGADGKKVGEVRGLLEDPDGRTRFLEIELDQTTLAQNTPPGQQGGRIIAGAYPADPHRPGSQPLADVDPSAGESERTAFYNPGARQHAADFTGAVPRDDDGREGGSARLEHPRVLIPWDAARFKDEDKQVVLATLRGSDLAELPVYAPANA